MFSEITSRIAVFAIVFLPFLIAVVFHECAHGYAALFWGDATAQKQGRLTLNPLPHLDLFGTFLLPALMMLSGVSILFGWAKPVPIDPRQFRSFRKGLFWVSVAGPVMNVCLAFLSALAFALCVLWLSPKFYFFRPFLEMTKTSVYLNWALAFFNLLPLPPLDGSKVLESVLPLRWIFYYERMSRWSMFILLVLILTGALRVLFVPIEFCAQTTLIATLKLFALPL